jgi:putative membrane protein
MITEILLSLIALLHGYFLILEMFLWTRPVGLRVFRMTAKKAEDSKILAANQGLYNGFLAAGLLWSVFAPISYSFHLRFFFLACVLIAGIFGAWSVSKRIFWVQALPAILALASLFWERFSIA